MGDISYELVPKRKLNLSGYEPDPIVQPTGGSMPVPLGVRATVRMITHEWCQVFMEVRPYSYGRWWNLTSGDEPLWVARRYSGSRGDTEVPELYAISALKRQLSMHGATVLSLGQAETSSSSHPDEEIRVTYTYHATVGGGRLTVGLQPCVGGGWALVALA